MTSRLVRVKVKPGLEAEFEAHMKAFEDNVMIQEPDPKTFEVRRVREDDRSYIIFQVFADDAAYDRYANSDYHLAASPKGLAMLEGDPVSEFLDDLEA